MWVACEPVHTVLHESEVGLVPGQGRESFGQRVARAHVVGLRQPGFLRHAEAGPQKDHSVRRPGWLSRPGKSAEAERFEGGQRDQARGGPEESTTRSGCEHGAGSWCGLVLSTFFHSWRQVFNLPNAASLRSKCLALRDRMDKLPDRKAVRGSPLHDALHEIFVGESAGPAEGVFDEGLREPGREILLPCRSPPGHGTVTVDDWNRSASLHRRPRPGMMFTRTSLRPFPTNLAESP